MSKRRPQSASSLAALFRAADEAEQIARSGPAPDGESQTLSIRAIRPDPFQARRVLPPAVREGFIQGQLNPPGALAAWRAMAEDDPREAALLESQVVTLATSIREQELVNPITVCADGAGGYLLETGERRWWAHWWLVSVEKLVAFEEIRARVLPAASPARQAAENLQDSPLTAVQEACQIARLLLHLTERDSDHVVAILDGAGGGSTLVGYDIYRTALDLQRREVYGKWATVSQIMGRSERQLQRQLALLNLADGALSLADRAALTEGQLRDLVRVAEGTGPERQIRIVTLAAEYQLTGADVARLVATADLDQAAARLERQRQLKERQHEDQELAPPAAKRGRSAIMVERLRKLRRAAASYKKGGFDVGDLVEEIVAAGQPERVHQELNELTDYLLLLREQLALRVRGDT